MPAALHFDPLTALVIVISSVCNVALASCLHWFANRVHQLSICPTYGILTRQGIDRHWQQIGRRYQSLSVVFLDLDHMHDANTLHGYAEVDRRIEASLRCIRQQEVVGRWYSGDEIVIVCPTHEAAVAADRIAAAFKSNGLSATFGIVPCTSAVLAENVKRAADIVQKVKLEGRRGTIGRAA